MLLDEPATGLDPAGMRDMRDLVRDLPARGMTVLLSSHLLGEVEELCNRVAIVRKGGVAYEGDLAELKARPAAATGCGPPTTRRPRSPRRRPGSANCAPTARAAGASTPRASAVGALRVALGEPASVITRAEPGARRRSRTCSSS